MQEIPSYPEQLEPNVELPSDAKKIGDLLLGYEIPATKQPETSSLSPLETDQKLKRPETIRTKLARYREQRPAQPTEKSPELTTAQPPETPESTEVTEAQFDRRHEAIDETPPEVPSEPLPTQQNAPSSSVLDSTNTPARAAPTSPPPLVPGPRIDRYEPEFLAPVKMTQAYKKPLVLGTIAGAITGLVLVMAYLLK